MIQITEWDIRFMRMAREVSLWSKDPSKKIGAVAIDPIKKIELSKGYNGFPRKIFDTEERYADRKTKYKFVVHAEMNCIYNATYVGACLDGAYVYVYGLPVCSECAKGLIQVGIKRVYVIAEHIADRPEWKESWINTLEMFNEAGIEYQYISLNSLV